MFGECVEFGGWGFCDGQCMCSVYKGMVIKK